MEELESQIGKTDASLVRAFYERPLFRGANTNLPHSMQLEHERIFKEEVTALLGVDDGVEGGNNAAEATKLVAEVQPDRAASTAVSGDRVEVRVQRLRALFDVHSDDNLLPGQFASLVSHLGPKERKLVAWTDHCACLPRYLAGREEVRATVFRTEDILRSVMQTGGDWEGFPGVVTIARSEADGYVPPDIVGFVEEQVLAMLKRLFTAEGSRGFEVVYDDGLERTQAFSA